jgi:hypothetical protein
VQALRMYREQAGYTLRRMGVERGLEGSTWPGAPGPDS